MSKLNTTDLTKIIIVDDEIELMGALCDALSARGYDATGFSSAAEALQVLQKQDFDVLLLDLMMPEMDGIEFLKKSRTICPQIISIIMTGYATVPSAIETMKLGAFDYVLKPFKMDILLPVITRAMEMQRLKNENLQLRESMAIYDLAMTVSHTLDLNIILNQLADAVVGHMGADEVLIMLPANANNELYVAVSRGQQAGDMVGQLVAAPPGLGQGLEGNAFYSPFDFEIKTAINIPLFNGGKCVGVLSVGSKKLSSFPPGQIKTLKILASTAASALDNARLFSQLQKAEQQYRSIFENATEGIFRISCDGHYLMVNPAMAHILGYDKPEELLTLTSDTDYQDILNGKMRKNGYEHQVNRRDGTVIWVSENVRAVIDDTGNTLYYEGTITDITQRKEAEYFEREISRLDRLNLVGELAASISHEIRNPLTTIRGFLQMLKSKEDSSDKGYYDLMIEELDRANTIISDYLGMAKDKPLELRSCHLHEIIASLYPMILADARYSDKQVKLDLEDAPLVYVDEKEIRQLMLNLTRNGIEAMSPGGTLTIGTRSENDNALLFIRDEGPGFDQLLLNNLGTPFLTTKENGTGLGLAVCYRIAARHNANIKLDTGPQGTTFWVTFPRSVESITLF
ncbi:MAG: response regulator [Syntrophomonadaceae bacterium]